MEIFKAIKQRWNTERKIAYLKKQRECERLREEFITQDKKAVVNASAIIASPQYKRGQYERGLDTVCHSLPETQDATQYIYMLNFLRELICLDLQGDYLTERLYAGKDIDTLPAPDFYKLLEHFGATFEQRGSYRGALLHGATIYDEADKMTLDLSKDILLVRPWNSERLLNAAWEMREEDFYADAQKILGYYFTGMRFGWVYQPNHHLATAVHRKRGNVSLTKFNDTLLYPIIDTDGAYWIDRRTNEHIGEVSDYRLALIYTISRNIAELSAL